MGQLEELQHLLQRVEEAVEFGELDLDLKPDDEDEDDAEWEALASLEVVFKGLRQDRDALLPGARDGRWDRLGEVLSEVVEAVEDGASDRALKAISTAQLLLRLIVAGPPPTEPPALPPAHQDPLWMKMGGPLFGAIFFGVALPGVLYLVLLFVIPIFGGDPTNHPLTSRPFMLTLMFLTAVVLGVLFGRDIQE